MKLRRQQLGRIAFAVALILVSAFFASVIRNGLAQRNPLNALPEMQVSFTTSEGTTILPANTVRMDAYDWQFMFWHRTGGGKDLEIWQEIVPSWVSPNAAINLRFTFEPQSYKMFIKAEQSDFVEITAPLVIPGPEKETTYTLRVEGNWGKGKDVIYYVRMKVDVW